MKRPCKSSELALRAMNILLLNQFRKIMEVPSGNYKNQKIFR